MKKKHYKVGDIVLITGIYNTENNIVVIVKDFKNYEILEQWQTNTGIDGLTRKGFIKYLFDNKFIEKLNIEEFHMEDDF